MFDCQHYYNWLILMITYMYEGVVPECALVNIVYLTRFKMDEMVYP